MHVHVVGDRHNLKPPVRVSGALCLRLERQRSVPYAVDSIDAWARSARAPAARRRSQRSVHCRQRDETPCIVHAPPPPRRCLPTAHAAASRDEAPLSTVGTASRMHQEAWRRASDGAR